MLHVCVLGPRGLVFNVGLNVVRKLLSQECVLLKALGEGLPFEIAVGMNGRIWLVKKTEGQNSRKKTKPQCTALLLPLEFIYPKVCQECLITVFLSSADVLIKVKRLKARLLLLDLWLLHL